MLWRALTMVFTRIEYATFSLLLAAVVILGTLLWPNIALVSYVWQSQNFAAAAKFRFIKELIVGSPESIGGLTVILVIATAALLGVVVSMTLYVYQHKRTVAGSGAYTATGSGTLAAFFGIGCVACGPLLLGGAFATFGASAFLLLLPLHGAELGLLALILLSYAVYALAKVITAPVVCSVD